MNTIFRFIRGFPSPLFRKYTFLIFHYLYGETLGKLGTYHYIVGILQVLDFNFKRSVLGSFELSPMIVFMCFTDGTSRTQALA